MPKEHVQPTSQRIGELFYNRNPFRIPTYQRSYAWESEEIQDFVGDIGSLVEERARSGSGSDHFFGGMVTVLRDSDKGSYYEVIDGQQRLATFTMALALVSSRLFLLAELAKGQSLDQLARKASNHASEVLDDYVWYEILDDDGVKERRPRLRLSKSDDEFFRSLIEVGIGGADPSRNSHELLKSAWIKIDDELFLPAPKTLNAETIDKGINAILGIKDTLLADTYVIHMSTDNRATAYKLFSVLNDRGKSLTPGDLLRSRTLELSDGEEKTQCRIEEHWDDILGHKPKEVDAYLRAYYPSHKGVRVPQHELFDRFQKTYLTSVSATDVESFVLTLRLESELYWNLADGQWPYESPGASLWDRRRLTLLVKTLGHDLSLPLLLAAAAELKETEFVEMVSLLEVFAFRYRNIGGGHASKPGRVYYKHALLTRSGKFRIGDFRKELRVLLKEISSDAAFRESLRSKLNYEQSAQRKNIRYFISTLEDYWPSLQAGGGTVLPDKSKVIDIDHVEIEHIYPQNPMSQNVNKGLESIKHNLGNLACWGPNDNRSASNGPFVEKRVAYSKSVMGHLNELGELPDWTVKTYQSRENELVEWACLVFSV